MLNAKLLPRHPGLYMHGKDGWFINECLHSNLQRWLHKIIGYKTIRSMWFNIGKI